MKMKASVMKFCSLHYLKMFMEVLNLKIGKTDSKPKNFLK